MPVEPLFHQGLGVYSPLSREIEMYQERFSKTSPQDFEEILSRLRTCDIGDASPVTTSTRITDKERTNLVERAFKLAEKAHQGQVRKSGELYITHPIAVVSILNDWGITDEQLLAAGAMHDVVEDTDVGLPTIKYEFGEDVAAMVDGVSKFRSDQSSEETHYFTLKKVLQTSFLDPRVAILKLADRVHNMLTMDYIAPEKQAPKAQETLDVYSRLAESLGMWRVKTVLEELAFKYLDPESYGTMRDRVDNDPRSSRLFVGNIITSLERLLAEQNLPGKVTPRFNSCWTLKEKQDSLSAKGASATSSLSKINDLVSFRVTLPTASNCYSFMGTIHQDYGEIVDFNRFDEFMGKNRRINGYQALQTTLDFPQGSVEVALATKEMEEFNNLGIIHLINRGEKDLKDYLLKIIFTPSYRIRFFPRTATGVDFAYAIDPSLGASAEHILVNGVQYPISTDLPHASVVEVVAGAFSKAPPKEYLDYCLPRTQKIIEDQLRYRERDQIIEVGKIALSEDLAERGLLDLADVEELIRPVIYRLGCSNLDGLYFKAGSWDQNIKLISGELDLAGITKERLKITSVRIGGLDQPGIFNTLTSWIGNVGGNIRNATSKSVDGKFDIRLVVENIDREEEEKLRDLIKNDSRFHYSILV